MLRVHFVSDIHITALDEPRAVLFLRYLDKEINQVRHGLGGLSHLFLVGDIFDLWLGKHRHFINKYEPLIDRLKQLIELGVILHFFEGNHDLYLHEFWQDQLGIKVHRGPEFFRLGPWTVRVEHGDEIDPEDKGYLFLRWLLRTPAVTLLARHLPDRSIVAIGERASQHSRVYTSQRKTQSDEIARKKLRIHAEQAFVAQPFDLLVNGHVHVRDDFRWRVSTREIRAVNLGTWLTQPVAFELTADRAAWVELSGLS